MAGNYHVNALYFALLVFFKLFYLYLGIPWLMWFLGAQILSKQGLSLPKNQNTLTCMVHILLYTVFDYHKQCFSKGMPVVSDPKKS